MVNDIDVYFQQNNQRPDPEFFMKFLPFFLEDIPNQNCPKAGHAAYGQAVKLKQNDENKV